MTKQTGFDFDEEAAQEAVEERKAAEDRKQERRERYADRQEAKVERLEDRAAKARSESESGFAAADRIASGIPMGQPILVGHHSEKRHRRDIARIDSGMRKGIEASKKASHLERRAERVGTGGVSSDNPDAADLLREQLAKLEERREAFKAHNRKARKEGGEKLPSYCLTNLGANIRRVKGRIAELEAAEAAPERDDVEGDGWAVSFNKDENRLQVSFDDRLSKEHFKLMRSAGFVFSRANECFQRKLSNGARYQAQRALTTIFGEEVIL